MPKKLEILLPDCIYHIYNRANGSERLFYAHENYYYFLKKYVEYIHPIADTFCYCLIPNHFHFLIRIKAEKEQEEFFTARNGAALQGFKTLEGLAKQSAVSRLISLQFSHFFNAYTQALNKQQQRKGSLFMHPFKRKRVNDENYLRKLVHYIHYNPIEARLATKLHDWEFSSYPGLISGHQPFLNYEVLGWFQDTQNFIQFHQREIIGDVVFIDN